MTIDSMVETGKILDAANAAREASPADKKSFKMTALYIGVFLFGWVAAFISGAVLYKKYAKEPPIERTFPAIPANASDTKPESAKPSMAKPLVKSVAKPVAKESLTAKPKLSENKLTVKILQPDPLAPALAEFEKRVLNFESKL